MTATGAKILLIEDDPGIADTLCRVLAEEGHEVTVKGRGDEGLAHAAAETVNVVIADLRLPGVGGLELIQRLRASQPRLPVILITAFGTTDTAIEAAKFGAYD
jgi:DNA-binding NtrC family response regulator